MESDGGRKQPYVAERRVVLVPRHIDGTARTPLEFPTMAKAAEYLCVPAQYVREAFVKGCMVTSRADGKSWFVDAKEGVPEDGGET